MEQQSSSVPNTQPTPNQVQDETFGGQSRSFIEGTRADIKAQNLSKKELRAFASEAADEALTNEDPKNAKYAADHLRIYQLLTASDKRFEQMLELPDGVKKSERRSKKVDDAEVPTVGDMSLAELKAARQNVKSNPAELKEELDDKFSISDPKDRQYNRNYIERRRYSTLLSMDDDEFKKEAAKWEKRAARNAKKEARRSERAARRDSGKNAILSDTEATALSETANGLVGRFAEAMWYPGDLEKIREYHEAGNTDAIKALIQESTDWVNHKNLAERNKHTFHMVDQLNAYAKLSEAERSEVNSALGTYVNHLDAVEDAEAKKAERLTSKLRAKAMGGIALLGSRLTKIREATHDDRVRMSATLRDGISSLAEKARATEDQPNILRRAHDWAVVEAGIKWTDAQDKIQGTSAQHAHETREQYDARVLKAGKRIRNVAIAALTAYGVSRVMGISEIFHGGGGNTVAQHSDTITNVATERITPSPVHHTELASGGIGGGHPVFEDQDYSTGNIAEPPVSSVGGGREVEDWINAGHDIKPKGSGANTLPGGVGGGHEISEEQGYGHSALDQSTPSNGGGRDIEDWKNAGHNRAGSNSVDSLGPNEPGVNGNLSLHEMHVDHIEHVDHVKHVKHLKHLKHIANNR